MGNTWSSSSQIKDAIVLFEGKKLRVVFSQEDYNEAKQIPLQRFRTKLAKSLKVPATSLKLFKTNPQTPMANMGATMESYGVKSGDELMAIADKPAAKPTQANLGVSGQIQQIMDTLRADIGTRYQNFISSPPADREARTTEHRILGEIVLAKTIALDNIEVTTPEERQERKNAINQLQVYHKNIDSALDSSVSASNAVEAEPVVAVDEPTKSAENGGPNVDLKSKSKKGKKGKKSKK